MNIDLAYSMINTLGAIFKDAEYILIFGAALVWVVYQCALMWV